MRVHRAAPLFLLILSLTGGLAAAETAVTPAPVSLDVVLSEKVLHVKLGDEVLRTYGVAIGTIDHPTPEGEFLIEKMIWNPGWVPPDSEWAEGLSPVKPGSPKNPMRVVKMPFDPPYYYIHGTDRPESIGTLASHGCIRMREADARELGRLLMEIAAEDRPESWYRNLVRRGETATVDLLRPIAITIRMGEQNVYPGVIWAVR